jgi:putative tryptophan/tyrosine transport system substrate-binding protein
MRRREFIAGLLLAATKGRAQAQQPAKMHRIAIASPSILLADMTETGPPGWRAFFAGLRRLGYIEGDNLTVERYSTDKEERFAELARDVVDRKPDLIFASSSRMVLRFKVATTVIPIVGITADPLASGIVTNLARPGGNITGVSADAGGLEIWGKRLALLSEVVPGTSRVSYLASRTVWENTGAAIREVAQRLAIFIAPSLLEGSITEPEYRRVFATISEQHVDAMLVGDQPEHYTYGWLIAALAQENRVPAIYTYSDTVKLGGLMAYAYDVVGIFRHAADQIGEILKGTNPGQIPYYQSTKFELVINLKTAKELGIELPPSLLARADEVIE